MADEKVSISYRDTKAEFDVLKSVDGPDSVDVSKLLATTGLSAFDGGFVNTASTKSAITYIDGEAGILRYRGYPIEELAGKKNFLETAYLLIYGELPTAEQATEFENRIMQQAHMPHNIKSFFDGFPQNAHPMSVLSAGVSVLATYSQDALDPHDDAQVELATSRLLAQLPILAAYTYKMTNGEALPASKPHLGYVENFLQLTFGSDAEAFVHNPVVTEALDTLLVLHADHEQNCSTSTVRLVGSSQANLFASISAGINALSGPLHGGANEAVIQMLMDIRDSGESVQHFVNRVKNKEEGVRLMGFGHRVYKSFDPRARIVKAHADSVLLTLGVTDPLLDIAKELEAAALADDYFVTRKLYPNVDFYTGVIYKAMGFPPKMFTPLFALGRLPGWISQWREMMADPSTRIGRPQQLYIGSPERHLNG